MRGKPEAYLRVGLTGHLEFLFNTPNCQDAYWTPCLDQSLTAGQRKYIELGIIELLTYEDTWAMPTLALELLLSPLTR